ncbi:hypothetical protein FHS59_001637 [Algoriphagus iocasae]|uniref:Restriction endonuclease type IV Mrr domain-containing protein n=1 Tax=Algoriphagus iocasae TaxID=1836499 RepID=A0A841MKU4_9BACT|nr:restriction endonuclease [Algoriphagus iocasae]MBB6326009.1 hypothetical protein [Algoriphagus iocasae]
MEQYLQTAIGIFVSVFLFILGYRQTIGARKERVKTCNEKLIETILRRIILEKYNPKKDDVKRLIEGKARDYKVKQKDLLSEDQILNTIYTRIFENDLISQEQRDENIERLSALFVVEKKQINQDLDISFLNNKDRTRKFINTITILLAFISTTVGVLVVSFDSVFSVDKIFDSNILVTVLGSIAAIITVYTFLRVKDYQESSEEVDLPKNPYRDHVKFEREVVLQLKKLNIETIIPNSKDVGFDLIAIINGEKVAVEIKYWRLRPPFVFLRQVLNRLKSSMDKERITRGLVVTNDKFGLDEKLKIEDNIDIIDIKELKTLKK